MVHRAPPGAGRRPGRSAARRRGDGVGRRGDYRTGVATSARTFGSSPTASSPCASPARSPGAAAPTAARSRCGRRAEPRGRQLAPRRARRRRDRRAAATFTSTGTADCPRMNSGRRPTCSSSVELLGTGTITDRLLSEAGVEPCSASTLRGSRARRAGSYQRPALTSRYGSHQGTTLSAGRDTARRTPACRCALGRGGGGRGRRGGHGLPGGRPPPRPPTPPPRTRHSPKPSARRGRGDQQQRVDAPWCRCWPSRSRACRC